MSSTVDHEAANAVAFPQRTEDLLTAQERAVLERYGGWLRSLADGSLAPTTPEQVRFVQVARGELPPQSPYELAWCKSRRITEIGTAQVNRDEVNDRLVRLSAARATVFALQRKYEERRDEILQQVRPQLAALEADFAGTLRDAKEDVERSEREVRQAVMQFGASCTNAGIHATYTRSRVLWDGKGLSEYVQAHPEVWQFRRIGNPTVSLRYLPAVSSIPPVQVTHVPPQLPHSQGTATER